MSIQVGQIIGIAKRQAKRAKMEVLSQAHVNMVWRMILEENQVQDNSVY